MRQLRALALLALCSTAAAQITMTTSSTPVRTGTTAPGINLGTINYYNDGQVLKNMAGYINPGFEPGLFQLVNVVAAAGTTTTFQDSNQYDTTPANQWAGASFVVTNSQSGGTTGCSGTIASNTGPNGALITAVQISSNVAIFTANNSFVAGQGITFGPGFNGAGFLNNYTAGTVSATGLSSTQFEMAYTHADYASTADFNSVAAYTSNTHPVFTTSAACAGAFAVGDTVFIKQQLASTPETYLEHSMGGFWASPGAGAITPDTTDLCATCGEQALDVNGTAGAVTIKENFEASSAENLFRILNGSYTISYWAKSKAGSTTAMTVNATRPGTNAFSSGNFTDTLTSTWTLYTHAFTASEVGIASGNANCVAGGTQTACTVQTGGSTAYLQIQVNGGEVLLDNVSLAPTTSSNTSIFTDNFVNTLAALNPGYIRYWLGQNSETAANWLAPDYARQPTGQSQEQGPIGSTQFYPSLNDFLVLLQNVQSITGDSNLPYIEIPVTTTTADAACEIQFLAAATGGCAAQRIALGQTTPWVGASGSPFSQIRLSFCNECWNSSFAQQNLPSRSGVPNDGSGNAQYYYDYQVRANQIITAMRADASYTTAIKLGVGTQTAISYTADDLLAAAHPDYVEINGYWYNYVSSSATDAALWMPFWADDYSHISASTDPSNYAGSMNDFQAQAVCGPSHTATCEVTAYEEAPSVAYGSIASPVKQQAEIGAGTAVSTALETGINIATYGVAAQNYFAINEFSQGNGNKLWGLAVDFDGATRNMRPQYYALKLMNQAARLGTLYSCPVTGSSNLVSYAANTSNGTASSGSDALSNVPLITAYCFGNGSTYNTVLVNASLSSQALTIAGPLTPTGAVTVTTLGGGSPDLENEAVSGTTQYTAAAVVPATTTATGLSSITLPEASVVLVSYSGSTPTAATPTFSPAAGSYTSAQTVAISDATAGATIYYTTNGTTPTTSSSVYSTPLAVSATTTVNAIAVLSGDTNSAVGTAAYTITIPASGSAVVVGSGVILGTGVIIP